MRSQCAIGKSTTQMTVLRSWPMDRTYPEPGKTSGFRVTRLYATKGGSVPP
ncbi:MAG: hypothetical protein ORN51_04870 [Akkermansiaceae bacterium]|nr:hypothetical protein [Akkermansiaceae bacterium]